MQDEVARLIQGSEFDTLAGSIEHTPIATVITNPHRADNPIVAANSAFCRLTGYPPRDIIGRNCRFLGGPGTEPSARMALAAAISAARSVLVEITNYRRDGTPFRNAVMIAPVLDALGSPAFFIGSQMDLGAAGQAHAARQAEASALVSALTPRQRQVLDHLIRGYRNKQIAGFLGIDEKTVKMHRARLLARLHAPTSADAIRIGVEAGLSVSDPG